MITLILTGQQLDPNHDNSSPNPNPYNYQLHKQMIEGIGFRTFGCIENSWMRAKKELRRQHGTNAESTKSC